MQATEVDYETDGFRCECCPAFPHGEMHLRDCPARKLRIGTRVALTSDVDRFPEAIVPRGTRGTITELTPHYVSIHLDIHVPEFAPWDNCLMYYPGQGVGSDCDAFADDLILVGFDSSVRPAR